MNASNQLAGGEPDRCDVVGLLVSITGITESDGSNGLSSMSPPQHGHGTVDPQISVGMSSDSWQCGQRNIWLMGGYFSSAHCTPFTSSLRNAKTLKSSGWPREV